MCKTVLTKESICFIKANRLTMSGSAMATMLDVSKSVVTRFLRDNGLAITKELKIRFQSEARYKPFTPEEDVYITEHIQTESIKTMASTLKRTSAYVSTRCKELGFGNLIEKHKLESRIKPGNIPANKGKKQADYMTPEAIAKTTLTRFQKGGLPGNTLFDGAITTRYDHKNRGGKPYKFIRLSKGKWLALQIYNLQLVNGPVPKGMCLWCKDGDTLNCEPENWELVTRAENMRRNSGYLNMTDGYLAGRIAGKNHKDLQEEILKNKLLLEIKRQQLILKRTIRQYDDSATN